MQGLSKVCLEKLPQQLPMLWANSSPILFIRSFLIIIENIRGIIRLIKTPLPKLIMSISTLVFPINNIYTGSKSSCSIKFRGSMEEPSATFPFAIPVNIRYQSVHGITISSSSLVWIILASIILSLLKRRINKWYTFF